MTRGNAREILDNTLERFKTTTNEAVGVVFTWNSGLTVLGCNDFKEYVTENKEAVWAAVGMTKTDKYSLSKSLLDQEMVFKSEDLDKLSVASLRKRISWLIQSQLGKFLI